MKNFVEIETLYSSLEERTIENLSQFYRKKRRLYEVVQRLMNKYFTEADIRNKSVLLKPNWVRHELKENDYICLRTNDNILIYIIEILLSLSPSKILIADAPVQGCNWDKMISLDFLTEIDNLSKKYHIPIYIKDFRRTVEDIKTKNVDINIQPPSDYIIFDLGNNSYLEPITTKDNRFRVTCYNPESMAKVHHKGMHKYCIANEIFDYDVIILIPKLKTHRMAGMTNALKLLIGINGDKGCLPHHRIGSLSQGGDNYPKKNVLRTLSAFLTDHANKRKDKWIRKPLIHMATMLWRMSNPDKTTLENAGWYGNDTIWRTVLDVNKIALYGDKNGIIHDNQQRTLFSIMDGVIGGQGDGPLNPVPSPLGIIAISDNSYLMDVVAAKLYHLNDSRIPLIREARKIIDNIDYSIIVNSKKLKLNEVSAYGIDINMSPGWEDYNK